MKKIILLIFVSTLLVLVTGCSSPTEKALAYYQSAQKYFDNKEYDKASVELKNALKINPKLSQAYYLSGLIHEKNKNWKAMYINMANANKLSPNHAPTITALGKIDLLSGEYEQANEKAAQAFALDANSVDAAILKSAILYKQFIQDDSKQTALAQRAIAEIEKALALEPDNLEAISLYVAMSIANKNYDQIIKVIDKGSVNVKNKKELTVLKIKTYADQGNTSQVINLFGELIFDEQDNLEYRQALALYFVRLNDIEGAKQVLRDAVVSNPDNIQAKLTLAAFLAEQDLDEAAEELKKFTLSSANKDQNQLRFALAEIYQQKGDKEKALDVYQNILDESLQESDVLLAKNSQTRIAISDKEYNEANKLIADVLQKEPNNSGALFNRALVSISKNNIEAAITDLRIVLRDNPDNEKTLELMALAYLKLKNYALADKTLLQILEINPFHQKAASQYAFMLLKKQDFEKVIKVLKPLESSGKLDDRGYALLMQARLSVKDWQAAEHQAQNNTSAKKEQYESYIQALILQGKDQYQESSEILQVLLKNNPEFKAPLVALINNYDKQKDPSGAIQYLLQVIKNNPEHTLASVLLAKQYEKNKQRSKAVAVYQDLIQKHPEDLGYYTNMAQIYAAENETKKAIDVYKTALEKNEDSLSMRFQLASQYENYKQFDKAIEQYNIIYEKAPTSKAVANNLASLLSLYQPEKELERAHQIAKQFDDTQFPAFADTLGWIYYLKGDYDNALRLLSIAVKKNPDNATFNYHLGKIYHKKNDREKTKIYIENSIKLSASKENFDDYDDAQQLLNKLL